MYIEDIFTAICDPQDNLRRRERHPRAKYFSLNYELVIYLIYNPVFDCQHNVLEIQKEL